ncbi:hypothetical protein [Dyella agri]|uniref:hypothetical protein n=1 Tax=Dyella agri TaxID=1926869 RepID=UPI00384D81A6
MLLLCVASLDVPAADAPRSAMPASRTGVATAAATASAQPVYVDGLGTSVSGSTLAHLRGGIQTTETMTLNGSVDHNTDNQVVTGSNLIDGGAFSGAVGLPTVIQNSGNNVLIQTGVIVNVQFKP